MEINQNLAEAVAAQLQVDVAVPRYKRGETYTIARIVERTATALPEADPWKVREEVARQLVHR